MHKNELGSAIARIASATTLDELKAAEASINPADLTREQYDALAKAWNARTVALHEHEQRALKSTGFIPSNAIVIDSHVVDKSYQRRETTRPADADDERDRGPITDQNDIA